MGKMKCESPDLTQANIAQLKELFPSVVTEARDKDGQLRQAVNFEALRQLLSSEIIAGDEAYEFNWVGKKAATVEAGRPIRKTLRPCVAESKNWDTTENLYIEGDNLDVLKLLRENYMGRIKMIYIDPPYNTGNDFIYRDDFKIARDEYEVMAGEVTDGEEGAAQRLFRNSDSSGRFHSDWCSMIYPRLMLARNLLSPAGVIFISCDDNERENLKKICDEIFGETNYLNNFAWVANITGRQIAGAGAAKTWESILAYARDSNAIGVLNVGIQFARENMPDAYKGFSKEIRQDAFGPYVIGDTLYNHNRKFNEETRPNLVFGILYNPATDEIIPGDLGAKKEGFVEISPHKNGDGTHRYHAWRWSRQKIINESHNLIVLPTASRGYEIYTKNREFNTTLLKDIITNIPNGDAELYKLFANRKYFDYPKSVALLKLLIGALADQDAIILDFFSGSATTAHAVMQLNAEDGGKRKFIMVQLPEVCASESEAARAGYKNICEIGKERIRRAGEKIKRENAGKPGIAELDIGFRVLKCDSSNMKDVYYTPAETEQGKLVELISNIKADRDDLDLLFGCLLEWGLPLCAKHETLEIDGFRAHFYDNDALACCFDPNVSEAAIKAIARRQPLRAVFRDASFARSQNRINAGEIFKAISPDTVLRVI